MTKRTRSCFCNECFYCFIQNDNNKKIQELCNIELHINVAEYVGPEIALSNFPKITSRLQDIPIQIIPLQDKKH